MSEPGRQARAPIELLADLLDGGILVVTPAAPAGVADGGVADGGGGAGIATLLQPDGDVVTLLAGTAADQGPGGLARHAAAVRQTTRTVRRAARRLRWRARLAGSAGVLLGAGGIAGGAAAFGRALEPAVWGWLAPLAGLFGVASAAAVLLPAVGRAAARRGRARRTAAANRAWLRDHGFQSGGQGLSCRALTRRV